MFSDNQKVSLKKLGRRLKTARIELNDPQKEFAFRLGVSIPTLYKMEKGNPKVSIGTWVRALDILNKLDELNNLIAPQKSLAERYESLQKTKNRQRVRRKK